MAHDWQILAHWSSEGGVQEVQRSPLQALVGYIGDRLQGLGHRLHAVGNRLGELLQSIGDDLRGTMCALTLYP